MIAGPMPQLPGIDRVGLYRPTHRMAAGLGAMYGGHPTQAYNAGDLYAMPFWLPEPATLRSLKLQNITVAAAAGKLARLGIARWRQGVASSPAYQGGTVAIDSTGAKTLDCSAAAFRLAAGWHAALLLLEAGITAEYLYQGDLLGRMFLSHHGAGSAYPVMALLRTGVAWGTFPDPLGTWTLVNWPPPPLLFVELTP